MGFENLQWTQKDSNLSRPTTSGQPARYGDCFVLPAADIAARLERFMLDLKPAVIFLLLQDMGLQGLDIIGKVGGVQHAAYDTVVAL